MDKQVKSDVTWGLVAVVYHPVLIYLAIVGLYTLPVRQFGLVTNTRHILVGVLLLVSGVLYIRNFVRTFRAFTSGPQSDLSNGGLAAYFVWSGAVLVLAMVGIWTWCEVHPMLFRTFGRVLGAMLIAANFALFVQITVRSYQAFLQGMRQVN